MAEQKTDCQIPLAAETAASCVSSETCADASKPVIVYCVSRKPRGRTYHQNMLWLKPELFCVWVKTSLKLAWSDGAKIRIPTITRTPATCQKTEMPFSRATR